MLDWKLLLFCISKNKIYTLKKYVSEKCLNYTINDIFIEIKETFEKNNDGFEWTIQKRTE